MPDNQDILARLEAIELRQQEILRGQKILYRQIEALFALHQQIVFRAPLLDLDAWSISPDLGAILMQQIQERQPKIILELGAGKSTLISAYCLQELGSGHVYALDHQEQFASITRENIARQALSDYAIILYAPLKEYVLSEQNYLWYDLDALPDDMVIDFLLIDGPPQAENVESLVRYPALPLLYDRLAENALIILDDADRWAETQIVEKWLAEFPLELLRHYDSHYADSAKGAKLLRKKSVL